jgi:hypothetical protein
MVLRRRLTGGEPQMIFNFSQRREKRFKFCNAAENVSNVGRVADGFSN